MKFQAVKLSRYEKAFNVIYSGAPNWHEIEYLELLKCSCGTKMIKFYSLKTLTFNSQV